MAFKPFISFLIQSVVWSKKVTLLFTTSVCLFCIAQGLMAQDNTGSLYISEIFPDPTPSLGLPEREFVELVNLGDVDTTFMGFSLCDADKCYALPNFSVLKGECVIICKTSDALLFEPYGKVLSISTMISLNNDGDNVYIKSKEGKVIDQVSYQTNDVVGGITLERNGFDNKCPQSDSFWQKKVIAEIGSVGQCRPSQITGSIPAPTYPIYSKAINDSVIISQFSDFIPNNGFKTLKIKDYEQDLEFKNFHYDTLEKVLRVELSQKLMVGFEYFIKLEGITDCFARPVKDTLIVVILPHLIEPKDILVNEVLFNPKVGGVDFIEFINASNFKIIDINQCTIANIDKGDTIAKILTLTKSLLLKPKQIIAFTSNKAILENYHTHFNSDAIAEFGIPSLNDDKGSVALISSNKELIDRFDYSDQYHQPLLNTKEGVSLERISILDISNNSTNWHSAAENIGFASPGLPNSHAKTTFEGEDEWELNPIAFNPYGGTLNDFTLLEYQSKDLQNTTASIDIFDANGRLIKNLVPNSSLSEKGFFKWDGTKNSGELTLCGQYIIVIRLVKSTGETKTIKKQVVVTSL